MKTQMKILLQNVDTLLQQGGQAQNIRNTTARSQHSPASVHQTPRLDNYDNSLWSESCETILASPGWTTSAFDVETAKSALGSMDLANPAANLEGDAAREMDPRLPPTDIDYVWAEGSALAEDPLWDMSLDEAIRLCKLYEATIGVLYPVVDISVVIRHANTFFESTEAAKRLGFASSSPHYRLDDDDCILRIILAISFITEQGEESETGKMLCAGVQRCVSICLWKSVTLKRLQFLAIIVHPPT